MASSLLARRGIGLIVLLQSASAGCSLFNPLDYLQADGDPADLPPEGCPTNEWEECGVRIAASPQRLGDVNFGWNQTLFYLDQATGEILQTTCDASGCAAATVTRSGEDAPRRLTHDKWSFAWTTRTGIRSVYYIDPTGVVATLDLASESAEIAGSHPDVVWADDSGARACTFTQTVPCKVRSLWSSSAASAPLVAGGRILFVAGGEIRWCTSNQVETCAIETLPGSQGAELLADAPKFSTGEPGVGPNGLLASVADGSGAKIVLAQQLDDAGKPLVLVEEPRGVRAIAAWGLDVYWTTTTGELRRKRSGSAEVTAILRGLSDDTTLVATEAGVAIGDRGRNQVLYIAP